jgi:hypothetical protein
MRAELPRGVAQLLRSSPRRWLVLLCVAALLGAGTLTIAAIGAAKIGISIGSGSSASTADEASLRFWTPQRMRDTIARDERAELPTNPPPPRSTSTPSPGVSTSTQPTTSSPGDSAPPVIAAQPVARPYTKTLERIEGRVFARVNSTTSVSCSGTLVDSPGRDLVWTAAHCVQAGSGGARYTDIVFVPAYASTPGDIAPYGTWPIRVFAVSADWRAEGGPTHSAGDFAALVADTQGGKHLEDVVGAGAKPWFDAPYPSQVSAYGYPVEPPFNGGSLYVCQSPASHIAESPPSPDLLWIGCTMTPGASGGGWFTIRNGQPYLVSNFSMSSGGDFDFGPPLDEQAKTLYEVMGVL